MLLVGVVQINNVIDKKFVEQMETLTSNANLHTKTNWGDCIDIG
jgi:hypothetical protein